ncbi:MAG: hypothetical protein J7M39_14145 [Anaerolineae bacterium]|nr:hypothetical protein [Anaerolineae bacterium]
MRKIVITVDGITLAATLNESPTATQVWEALPIQAHASIWGDEIYLEIPVDAGQAPDARVLVDVGTLGYWPVGKAFCIFFGPTPAGTGSRPQAYSPINILGEVTDDATRLRGVRHGASVRIAKAKDAESLSR